MGQSFFLLPSAVGEMSAVNSTNPSTDAVMFGGAQYVHLTVTGIQKNPEPSSVPSGHAAGLKIRAMECMEGAEQYGIFPGKNKTAMSACKAKGEEGLEGPR